MIQVPEISEYNWPKGVLVENLNKMVQLNGSLAIQLAYNWLKEFGNNKLNGLSAEILSNDLTLAVSGQVIKAFEECIWPGRCQTMEFHNLRLHLDGAHTLESMEICGDWFESITKESSFPKILIFNATGERDSKALLSLIFRRALFVFACFVPNIPFTRNTVGDIHSVYGHQDQLQRAAFNECNWRELISASGNDITQQERSRVFGTILEAFLHLKDKFEMKKIDILVTGSIHLLGATILAVEEFEKSWVKQTLKNNINPKK